MTGNTRTVFILVRDYMTKMAKTTVVKRERERELTMESIATAVMVSLMSRSNSDC